MIIYPYLPLRVAQICEYFVTVFVVIQSSTIVIDFAYIFPARSIKWNIYAETLPPRLENDLVASGAKLSTSGRAGGI
jgi:hypothetical protein